MDYVIPLRFKQGDHVVVRPDLNINTVYQTFGGKNAGYRATPTLNMVRLAGSEFEIKEYSRSQKNCKTKVLWFLLDRTNADSQKFCRTGMRL